jgi:hypothetical protein
MGTYYGGLDDDYITDSQIDSNGLLSGARQKTHKDTDNFLVTVGRRANNPQSSRTSSL